VPEVGTDTREECQVGFGGERMTCSTLKSSWGTRSVHSHSSLQNRFFSKFLDSIQNKCLFCML
jgi:hypothetical protein